MLDVAVELDAVGEQLALVVAVVAVAPGVAVVVDAEPPRVLHGFLVFAVAEAASVAVVKADLDLLVGLLLVASQAVAMHAAVAVAVEPAAVDAVELAAVAVVELAAAAAAVAVAVAVAVVAVVVDGAVKQSLVPEPFVVEYAE